MRPCFQGFDIYAWSAVEFLSLSGIEMPEQRRRTTRTTQVHKDLVQELAAVFNSCIQTTTLSPD